MMNKGVGICMFFWNSFSKRCLLLSFIELVDSISLSAINTVGIISMYNLYKWPEKDYSKFQSPFNGFSSADLVTKQIVGKE